MTDNHFHTPEQGAGDGSTWSPEQGPAPDGESLTNAQPSGKADDAADDAATSDDLSALEGEEVVEIDEITVLGDDLDETDILNALEAVFASEDDDDQDDDGDETDEGDLEMEVTDIVVEAEQDGYVPLTMLTTRGDIQCRYYQANDAARGVIFVGDTAGDFDSPARDLFPRLADDLKAEEVSSLRIRFRNPTDGEEALLDVLAGLGFLESEGIMYTALVGHSLGGAVVLEAAMAAQDVRAVVALATMDPGAEAIVDLPEDCAVLFLHGQRDAEVPAETSTEAYALAHEPKQLNIYEKATHSLDEVADDVYAETRNWLLTHLQGDDDGLDDDDDDE